MDVGDAVTVLHPFTKFEVSRSNIFLYHQAVQSDTGQRSGKNQRQPVAGL